MCNAVLSRVSRKMQREMSQNRRETVFSQRFKHAAMPRTSDVGSRETSRSPASLSSPATSPSTLYMPAKCHPPYRELRRKVAPAKSALMPSTPNEFSITSHSSPFHITARPSGIIRTSSESNSRVPTCICKCKVKSHTDVCTKGIS